MESGQNTNYIKGCKLTYACNVLCNVDSFFFFNNLSQDLSFFPIMFSELFYCPCSETERDCIHSSLSDLPSEKVKFR